MPPPTPVASGGPGRDDARIRARTHGSYLILHPFNLPAIRRRQLRRSLSRQAQASVEADLNDRHLSYSSRLDALRDLRIDSSWP
jgi:hypothetical protein